MCPRCCIFNYVNDKNYFRQCWAYPSAKMFLYFDILTQSPTLNLGYFSWESSLYSAWESDLTSIAFIFIVLPALWWWWAVYTDIIHDHMMRDRHNLLHDIGHHPWSGILWSIMLTRSIGLQLLTGQSPESIANPGFSIALSKDAVAFYLLGIEYYSLPLTYCPMTLYILSAITPNLLPVTVCHLSIVLYWSLAIGVIMYHKTDSSSSACLYWQIGNYFCQYLLSLYQLKLSNKLKCRF